MKITPDFIDALEGKIYRIVRKEVILWESAKKIPICRDEDARFMPGLFTLESARNLLRMYNMDFNCYYYYIVKYNDINTIII